MKLMDKTMHAPDGGAAAVHVNVDFGLPPAPRLVTPQAAKIEHWGTELEAD